MEKYYTPKLEEFYIGFECEYNSGISINGEPSKWIKDTTDQDLLGIVFDSWEHPDYEDEFKDSFRIKYLDKEDIESLGFEETSIRQYIINACGDLPYWTHAVIDFIWKDDISIIGKRGQEVGILFRGKIKNKSELKKLLKMLCITK